MDKTIYIRFNVEGVPTDVTSMKASDPTATFGVKNVQTDEIVIADGVNFTHDGVGQYSLVIPDVVVGDEYTYWVERVYNGITKRIGNTVTIGDETYYVSQEYMEKVRGIVNIRKWSRKGGTASTTDVDAVNTARLESKLEIDGYLMRCYKVPLVNATATDTARLAKWSERIASYFLYIGRGLQEDDPTGNQLRIEYQDTIAEIERFCDVATFETLGADKITRAIGRGPVVVT